MEDILAIAPHQEGFGGTAGGRPTAKERIGEVVGIQAQQQGSKRRGGAEAQGDVHSEVHGPGGVVALEIAPDRGIALEHLGHEPAQVLFVIHDAAHGQHGPALGIRQYRVGIRRVVTERLKPGEDLGAFGRATLGQEAPHDREAHGVGHDGPSVAQMRVPPVGDLRDFHIGDGQQLVADLTLNGGFLGAVIEIEHGGNGESEDQESQQQRG